MILSLITGLATSPYVAFKKDKDLDMYTLGCLTMSCASLSMSVMNMLRLPFKPWMILIVCCVLSLFSTAMIATDTAHRFSRKDDD
jgi:hypothetical protein